MMGESSGSSNQMTLAIETETGLASYIPPVCFDPSGSSVERGGRVTSIEEIIKKSKSHWSQVGYFDSDNEVAEVSNMEVFKTLQGHPIWGDFFMSFSEGEDSWGDLVIGEKFAEGGQAELYEVKIEWKDPNRQDFHLKHSCEYVLKVFKKGTFLQHLHAHLPQGMLQFHAYKENCRDRGLPLESRFHCDVLCGILLEDGRFAFLMVKEREDLWSMIDRRMLMRSNREGPLSKREALEAMYDVALGMNQLHNRDIVHRDIKASNVLLSRTGACYIVDFECSVGVVGTGFFRAPEILEACKHRNVSTSKAELFTKAVDIYSYGMTCYEILTCKLPFEGHLWNDYDLVLQGQRPKVPKYVDGWIQKLLNRCWHSNPVARPSFGEILKILSANSGTCRRLDLNYQGKNEEAGLVRKALDRSLKFIDMWRSLKWKMQRLKMFRIYRR